jgi:hypothetical protein
MEPEDVVRAFERGEEPAGGFHHAQHVMAAWWYLQMHALPIALERFSAALRRFAAARGKPERYHETVTVAFLLVIAERVGRAAEPGWDAFAAANPDVLSWNPSVLGRYYQPETLWSDRARRTFVMPDRLRDAD